MMKFYEKMSGIKIKININIRMKYAFFTIICFKIMKLINNKIINNLYV